MSSSSFSSITLELVMQVVKGCKSFGDNDWYLSNEEVESSHQKNQKNI